MRWEHELAFVDCRVHRLPGHRRWSYPLGDVGEGLEDAECGLEEQGSELLGVIPRAVLEADLPAPAPRRRPAVAPGVLVSVLAHALFLVLAVLAQGQFGEAPPEAVLLVELMDLPGGGDGSGGGGAGAVETPGAPAPAPLQAARPAAPPPPTATSLPAPPAPKPRAEVRPSPARPAPAKGTLAKDKPVKDTPAKAQAEAPRPEPAAVPIQDDNAPPEPTPPPTAPRRGQAQAESGQAESGQAADSSQAAPAGPERTAAAPGLAVLPTGGGQPGEGSDSRAGGLALGPAGKAGRAGDGLGGAGLGAGSGSGQPVDRMPRVLEQVKPRYPSMAKRLNKSGVVTLRFLVDARGVPGQLTVVEAPPGGFFEESALEAVARWRFEPAKRQGRNVEAWMILPVRFVLEKS
jgi:protein TonB